MDDWMTGIWMTGISKVVVTNQWSSDKSILVRDHIFISVL